MHTSKQPLCPRLHCPWANVASKCLLAPPPDYRPAPGPTLTLYSFARFHCTLGSAFLIQAPPSTRTQPTGFTFTLLLSFRRLSF